jgi:hypothetical protein
MAKGKTRYAITYDNPRKYSNPDKEIVGTVEANLKALGGSIRRRPAGPKTTIGYIAPKGVTNRQVRKAVRFGLSLRLGRAVVAQLDTTVAAWTWPKSDLLAHRHSGTWIGLV